MVAARSCFGWPPARGWNVPSGLRRWERLAWRAATRGITWTYDKDFNLVPLGCPEAGKAAVLGAEGSASGRDG